MRFSQRIGKTEIKNRLQTDGIDNDLKNRLWSIIMEDFFDELSNYSLGGSDSQKGKYCKNIWKEFSRRPVDEIPRYDNGNTYFNGFIDFLKKWFYQAQWYEIYDLVEFILEVDDSDLQYNLQLSFNSALEKEVSGFRLLNPKVVQITSENEIQEIDEAIFSTDQFSSVNSHLIRALNLLADRKEPDFRNSIKESISAVESFCKIITNDNTATLGKALIEIEKQLSLHRALKNAFSALYGYTSDAGGIRHSLLEDDIQITFEDAKFMLVSCSAFINYLKSKTQ